MNKEEFEFSEELQKQKARIEFDYTKPPLKYPISSYSLLFMDWDDEGRSFMISHEAIQEFTKCTEDIFYWFKNYYNK